MEFIPTPRGFFKGVFKDNYGADCSLQESSACAEEGYIWFGMHDPELKYFIPNVGWFDVTKEDFTSFLPKGAQPLLSSRMHLNQSKMENLLPALMFFVKHGNLPDESYDETKQEMDGYRESVHSLRNSV
jgi:hypothetical protein